jgi:NAD(P)-dependent dehydrogenase (short-subunit alcohol dehydrogenase family)
VEAILNTRELFDLTGKTAIVTGGTTGLGKQMATGLAEMGSNIVIASLDQSLCENVADELRSNHRKTLGIEFDLASLDSINSMIDRVIEEFGKIDILVNAAAAVGLTTPLEPITPAIWDKMLRINLSGSFWCAHSVAESMKEHGGGKIINVCSVYAVAGVDPNLYLQDPRAHYEHFPYTTTKGGLLSLTRDMAANYARWQINVNAISPGMFPSPSVIKKYGEETFKKLQERTPLKRLGGEDDLKGAVAFLASAASDFVTGHNLIVDGGWLSW